MNDGIKMEGFLREGEKQFSLGNIEAAASCFRAILARNPSHADALNNLGVIAFHAGDFEEALSYFRKVIEIDETHMDATVNTARALCAKREFLEALKWYQKVLHAWGPTVAILNSVGGCFIELNDLVTARTVLEESLRIDGNQENVRAILRGLGTTATTPERQVSFSGTKLNIGFVSIWFERGQSYVTKTLRDLIAHEHNTFVFARTGSVHGQQKLETQGYWDVPNLTTYSDYQISPEVLEEWMGREKLDAVIFNEEYDWSMVRAVRRTGIKLLTYLDYYREDWKPLLKLYDGVFCSTRRTFDLVKDTCNAHYIGWGVDTDLFRPTASEPEFTFFHNAGWLGINYRKMTPAAIAAFDATSKTLPEVSMFIHSQVELEKLPSAIVDIVKDNDRITYHVGTLPAPGLYHKGKILVLPTKLEGLGLPLFEALSCGMPVIATNAPPMNEFIQDGYNGRLVNVAFRAARDDNIAFPETIVDMTDLALKMATTAEDRQMVDAMSTNARRYSENELALSFLGERVLSVLEEVCRA